VAAHKSTNVRIPAWTRLGLGLLVRAAPALAAALAERLFFTPPRPRASRGLAVLARGERFHVDAAGRTIAAWRWGRGPTVVLVHGWGGRAAQLTSFVAPLVDGGFSVVAFDAPGHGESGRGLSSAPEFARALRAVLAGEAVHGLVAHSLGAAAAALALGDRLAGVRVVFLGPAADPPAWIPPFADALGLSPAVTDLLRQRSERRLGVPWSALRLPDRARSMTAPLLVIHDRADREVPLRDGRAIAAAWPGARLVETTGLGHNGVLRDPAVIAEAVAHVADRSLRCACAAPADDGESCDACGLDRELFDRDGRRARTAAAAPAR
jgi:pimeloyl-ACP methyl ester carboxylesterase